MINKISSAAPISSQFITDSITTLAKKLKSEFGPDVFEHNVEYVTDLTIRNKRFGIKGKPQVAKLFKLVYKDSNTENYFLTKNGEKLLGEITFEINPEGVYICNLEAMAKHKGIGSKLLQLAIERGLIAAPENKIMLKAHRLHSIQNSPVGFYEKMGFHSTGNPSNCGIEMLLQPNLNPKWVNKINQSPIILDKKV